MALIQPNTTIQLMADVPLEAGYQNTLWWDNTRPTAQSTYFASKIKATFDNQSYQRVDKNTIKLQIGIEDSIGMCNYMRFANHSFENKWFYAFITSMEYISNDVVQFTYEIDVLQTWWFDFTHNMCFVEREHSATDQLGEYILEENLESGPYCHDGADVLVNTTGENFIVVASEAPNGDNYAGRVENQYTGLWFGVGNGITEFQEMLQSFEDGATQSFTPIISIQQYPSGFTDNTATVQPTHFTSWGLAGFRTVYPSDGRIHTYTPWNNKLYCYPYNFMTLSSPDGASTELKYELFKDLNNVSFTAIMGVYPMVEIGVLPDNYDNYEHDLNHAIFSKNFPTCGVASDAYKAWWAQNKVSTIVDGVTDVAGAFASEFGFNIGKHQADNGFFDDVTNILTMGRTGLAKGAVQAVATGVADWGSYMGQRSRYKATPDTAATKAGNAGVLAATNLSQFLLTYNKIHPQYAETIDNYLNARGYLVNRVKFPVYNNRPEWNYIKTSGCTINGNIPADHEKAICKIFDNGITVWKNPLHVGDYTRDNRPPDTYGTGTPGWSVSNG